MAPITNCMKRGQLIWTEVASQTFEETNKIMIETLVLRLPYFLKVFEVACDASHWDWRCLVKKAIPLLISARS